MKKKRVLSLLLALCLALALVPTMALADDVTITEVVPCQYDSVNDFSEGLAAVKLDDKWGFIDETGREVIPFRYDSAYDFSEGLAAVRLGDKWSFIDQTGREVIPFRYDSANDFSEGFAEVRRDDKWGFIDKTGQEVVPCVYEFTSPFVDGFAAVRYSNKWGFVDTTGIEAIRCRYDWVGDFCNGLAAVCIGTDVYGQDGKWGFIDQTGREVIPCQYDAALRFTDNITLVANEKGIGLIDKTGQIVAPFGKYSDTSTYVSGAWTGFSGGLLAVERDGKWGYLDGTGREVIPCTLEYDLVWAFADGMAAVRDLDGKIGFIDTTGREVIPCRYDEYVNLHGFSNGFAVVAIDGEKDERGYPLQKYGVIDKSGQEVVPCKYDDELFFFNGLASVSVGKYPDRKYGFIDATGKEVVPCKYDSVGICSEGLAEVCLDGKWGFISFNDSTTAPQTAYPSTQTVLVDGRPVTFHAYALKDANGNDTNYIKLRDVADILNGSAAQFEVGWDGSIAITTQTAYTPNGSENIANFSGDQSYTVNTSPVKVNGAVSDLEAITLTDASGGGYTYFKLRDLGEALGFNVSWDAASGISIDPNSPYDPVN